MIDLLIDLGLMVLIFLAFYGFGRAIRQLMPLKTWGRAADLAYTFAFGIGTASTLLFVLSLVGWLVPAAGWALLAVGVILSALHYRQLWADLLAIWRTVRGVFASSWFMRLAMLIGLLFVALNLIADLAPPVEGDTVHQYLLLSRYWAEAGRYVQPEHIWAAPLPGNMLMLSAWALILNHSFSLASLVTGFGMSLMLALGVYALARLYLPRGGAIIAAVAIYSMPDALYLAQSAKVDMGWAFFEALALASFFHWLDLTRPTPFDAKSAASRSAWTWLILAGVCLGLAAGSKNQTWISVALLGSWLLIRQIYHRRWSELVPAALIFGLAVIVAALPFHLYNGIVHHNPFYPVFADQFHRWFQGTPSPRSELGTEVFYPWSVGGYFINLWNASLGHTAPGFYLGFIAGPLFLLTIPAGIALGALRGKHYAWRMLAYALVFSVIWFLVKQAVRHFIPGLILLSVVVGLILTSLESRPRWASRFVQAGALIVLLINLGLGLAVMFWNGAYQVALGLETREEYLVRFMDEVTFPTFPDANAVAFLNSLPPSARIVAEHAGNPLYIERDVIPYNWGDRDRLDTITEATTLIEILDESSITHILVSSADQDSQALITQPEFLAAYGQLVFESTRSQIYQINYPAGE